MKKTIGLVLFSLVLTLAGFSQEQSDSGSWYNSYAPLLRDSKSLLLNFGVGFGFASYGSLSLPPITVGLDYKLPVAAPITIGAAVSLARYSWSLGYDIAYTDIGIGLRGDYHFNFGPRKLDTYAGLTLGYVIDIVSSDHAGYNSTGHSYFLYGFHIGGRYFFSDSVGAYLELGYSGLQLVALGVTFRI
jgi:hypothetical protein